MNAGAVLVVYLLVVIIVFLLLLLVKGLTWPVRLFLALLVGAIVLLLLNPTVSVADASERAWIGLIMLLAYLAPLILGAWIILTGQVYVGHDEYDVFDDGGRACKLRENYVCGEGGCVPTTSSFVCDEGKVGLRRV